MQQMVALQLLGIQLVLMDANFRPLELQLSGLLVQCSQCRGESLVQIMEVDMVIGSAQPHLY